MALELHPDAAANFDQKAIELLTLIGPAQQVHQKPGFQPERFIAGHVTDADIIGEVKFAFVNGVGEEVGKIFELDGTWVGLGGEGYATLRKLTEALQRAPSLRDTVSITSLTDLVFEWLELRRKGSTELPMTEHVLPAAERLITDQEIWIPVARLYVEFEFSIGAVLFKTLSSEVLEQWRVQNDSLNPEFSQDAGTLWGRLRKDLQGLAAATIHVRAEPMRAREIAFEKAEDALAMLRAFAPENLEPRVVSRCTPLGKDRDEIARSLTVIGGRLTDSTSRLVRRDRGQWVIHSDELTAIKRLGLDKLSRLLESEGRTEFQSRLLDTLRLYSRVSLAWEPEDKLIYLLVALESLFVRNDTEPLQQNIGERIAFLMSSDRESRRKIIQLVQKAYGLRSGFLHHGRSLDDIAVLRSFMVLAWKCLIKLVANSDRFGTVQQLLAAIDNEKLS